MAELNTLIKQRQTSKANVTQIKNLISSSMSLAELGCRLSLVEAYFKLLLSIQTSIEELSPNDTSRIDIEDLCIKTKSKIIELLGDNYKRQNFDTTISAPLASHSKLPSLKMPKFDGKYSTYKNFMSSFKQFVDDDASLSNTEKFNHLLHCLSGQALDTVRAFQITADNYGKAIKRLEERYDNKTLIFIEHIQNFYELPHINKSSGMQLRSLVDNALAIYGSLKSLGAATFYTQQKSHYTMLHRTISTTQNNDSSHPAFSSSSSPSAIVNVHLEKLSDGVILATAIILVRDSIGELKLCRAVLDSCSQVNLITENLVNILNLPKRKTSVNIIGVGSTSSKIKFETNTSIRSRYNRKEYSVNFYVTNRVSGYQPDMKQF